MENLSLYFEKQRYGKMMLKALSEELPAAAFSIAAAPEEAAICFNGFPSLSEVKAAIDAYSPDLKTCDLAPVDRSECRVTSFCACLGGCGLSTASSLLAMELSRLLGRRVMYVSFGLFAPEGLSVLCYRLLHGKGDPASVLGRLLTADDHGVYRAGGARALSPLRQLSETEAAAFFDKLASSGMFTDIVVDLPAGIPCFETVLSLSEYAVLIDSPWHPGSEEQLSFSEYFERLRGGLPTRIFQPDHDELAGDMDIHGQLGTQLRRALLSGEDALYA